jgi:hypothetical protein
MSVYPFGDRTRAETSRHDRGVKFESGLYGIRHEKGAPLEPVGRSGLKKVGTRDTSPRSIYEGPKLIPD